MFSTDRVVEVTVNLEHPFIESYFDQGEGFGKTGNNEGSICSYNC